VNKKRKLQMVLVILLIVMAILSSKLIIMKSKVNEDNKHTVTNEIMGKEKNNIDKYGYGDILECLKKNSDLQIQCINIVENEKCNVEVGYSGDMKLLYNSLHSLSENKNFLGVNSININNGVKIASISIAFKKNR
jgi:hypothetical protein